MTQVEKLLAMLIMHAPHPSDEMSRGAVRAAVRFLHGEDEL